MFLQRFHLLQDAVGFKHRDGGLLEGHVGAAIKIRATATDGFDEGFGPDDPGYAPSGKAETLRHAVDEEDIIFVHVFDVFRCADGRAITVACVVIPAIELVHDQRGAIAADVLDFFEFGVGHDLASGVARIGGEDYGCAAGDFVGDLVWVNVVAVGFAQGGGDGGKVAEEGKHLVVGGVVGDEES